MLVAITSEKKRVILNSFIPLTTLNQLKKETEFYCPQCGERLQLKVGSIKIPHFAHYANSNCSSLFSEGESEQHLIGKEQLYQFFKSLKLEVELEPYLPELKQRPDLFISLKKLRYASEYQCSPLSDKRFHERNNGYIRNGIYPIWIPITPTHKIIKQGIQKMSFTHQLLQFSTSNQTNPYILTYCPTEKQFVYLSNWIHVNGLTFLVKVSSIPIKLQHFPFYRPKPLSSEEFSNAFYAYEFYKKKYLKTRLLTSRKGVKDLFLRSIYELRLTIDDLPVHLGVPIKGNENLKLSAVEWQTALFYFLHVHDWNIQGMNGEMATYFLKWANLNHSEEAIRVVLKYCHVLNELSIQQLEHDVSKQQLKELLYSQFLAT